jgi:hypothetical protein
MRRRRLKLTTMLGAVAALALAGAGTGIAQEAPSGEAPPAEAEAVAAEVEGVAAVGHTQATADEQDGEATGNALELGDEPPSEQFGGTQTGQGESEGALIDTGDTPLGRLAVTPWSAKVERSESRRSAEAHAALLRVALGDFLSVAVLQSMSQAAHEGSTSTASSSSDGAEVFLGGDDGLHLQVLHAERSSDGTASSHLVGINDNQIFTSDDADGSCVIEIPELLNVTCLHATGGEAGGSPTGGVVESGAGVADVSLGGEEGLNVELVGASGTSGGAAQAAEAGEADTGTDTGADDDTGAAGAAELPRTGPALGALGLGLKLLAAGGALLLVRRRVAATV